MKIGFDVSQTAQDKAGCGYAADQLIRSLVEIDRENEYLLYPTFYSYRDQKYRSAANPESPNCKHHFSKMNFADMDAGWQSEMPDRTAWLGSPDIIHSNNFSCVKDHKARIVYTVYDLTPLVCPEFLSPHNRVVCFDGLFNAAMYADHCVAISSHTKKDFLRFFPHYPEDRVTVIPLGTRPGITQVHDSHLKEKTLKKFGISGEFWLGVGTMEPRKNFQALMDAFAGLNDGRQLALAGGKGWLEEEIENRKKQPGLADRVKFTGYVSDRELSILYSSCFAFVYPSFYEGFGLPVLEAMSCGASVITSRSSSLPEVGGDAVLYADPHSPEDLRRQMRYLDRNPQKRGENRAKAVEQAKKYSWEKAARRLLRVYKKTLKAAPYFNYVD